MGRRPRYPMTVCILGETNCPHDEHFVHDPYFGCVPRDFNERTGKSKSYRQTRREGRYHWNGGCGKEGGS